MSETDRNLGRRREETFYGYVENTKDAIIVFQACLQNKLLRATRRFTETERSQIRSGTVVVFDEKESGIRRWTDGKFWSPSRIMGNFLVYRELLEKIPPSQAKHYDIPQGDARCALSTQADEAPPPPVGGDVTQPATPQQPAYPHTPEGFGPQTDQAESAKPTHSAETSRRGSEEETGCSPSGGTPTERRTLPSHPGSYIYSGTKGIFYVKEGGLIKKTISLQVNGSTMHLVSYYKESQARGDLAADEDGETPERLVTPKEIFSLAELEVEPEMLNHQAFRRTLKVVANDRVVVELLESAEELQKASDYFSPGTLVPTAVLPSPLLPPPPSTLFNLHPGTSFPNLVPMGPPTPLVGNDWAHNGAPNYFGAPSYPEVLPPLLGSSDVPRQTRSSRKRTRRPAPDDLDGPGYPSGLMIGGPPQGESSPYDTGPALFTTPQYCPASISQFTGHLSELAPFKAPVCLDPNSLLPPGGTTPTDGAAYTWSEGLLQEPVDRSVLPPWTPATESFHYGALPADVGSSGGGDPQPATSQYDPSATAALVAAAAYDPESSEAANPSVTWPLPEHIHPSFDPPAESLPTDYSALFRIGTPVEAMASPYHLTDPTTLDSRKRKRSTSPFPKTEPGTVYSTDGEYGVAPGGTTIPS
ncbi:Global transcription regulator sge1 [Tieghemiomyces parasiticus]|uniref:Global transcription regulator sge1 n=1 Tax=Tieghemiomyces parasiticus TaxID=78921 RepID=A0A9W8A5B9_9FUNG|nr:Global transcription regulator sge1 [Tieghemiomyces parasiticus]